tara:strand:+ start:1332 stop:1709 length:378 start_codon:yes stop_codon:yes gene_type:complete
MSIEKIIAEAIDNNPLKLKEAFEDEMNVRIRAALEEKYKEMTSTEEEVVSEETEELVEEDEDESDEDDSDDDDDDEDMDEGACVREMKKLHASACSKTEMYAKIKEKYGCSKAKFNELYASNCGG